MTLIAQPHGGQLVQRMVADCDTTDNPQTEFSDLPTLEVDEDIACDLVNIANGAFSPLEGFLGSEEVDSVLRELRLPSGTVWSIPIMLPLPAQTRTAEGEELLLTSSSGTRALLEVSEIFDCDLATLTQGVYGTRDAAHPGVALTLARGRRFAAGRITLLCAAPSSFSKFALTPRETRAVISERGWRTVAGFQTRNVPHLAHEHVQKITLNYTDGLLIQPLTGWKKSGDFEDEAILAAYEALVKNYFPSGRVLLATLQTSMRYAGPREAVFHAIIRKNFGCTHFIVGRDHAGVGKFYDPYDAQRIFERFDPKELGVDILRISEAFVCNRCGGPQTDRTCAHPQEERITISGTKLRALLLNGKSSDSSIVRPEVLDALRVVPRLFVP